MISLILFIAGLVLLFVGENWFEGAHTVGLIITVVFAVLFVIQVVILGFVAKFANKQLKL